MGIFKKCKSSINFDKYCYTINNTDDHESTIHPPQPPYGLHLPEPGR